MPLADLIHITAAYSNAVLIAVLPHVTDFAKKLDLPVPVPITQGQVVKFNVNPLQGFVGGGLWLTNGYQFAFNNGCVYRFTILTNNPWLSEDPAQDWPHFVGKVNMTTNDAIMFARAELVKLGYEPEMLQADIPPTAFEGGGTLKQGGQFPYCQIKWRKEIMTIADKDTAASVTVQVNMTDKTLLGISIISRRIWQPEPVIDVKPELESDYRKRIQGTNSLPH
jgi:hypothetical protein